MQNLYYMQDCFYRIYTPGTSTCLYTVLKILCHYFCIVAVQISWTVSHASVTEGDVVRLSGTALGIYANPVAIGVYCKCSHLYSSDSEVEIGMYTLLYLELVI